MKIGVLALQGAFREHCRMLTDLGLQAVAIRKAVELEDLDGLILPGGESTVIGKMLNDWGMMEAVWERAARGMAVYGTCAGMILLAKEIIDSEQPRLGLMDITVRRNAFGRQCESFEADLSVDEFGDAPVRAVFIRAPYIEAAGPAVRIMAKVNDKIVVARQEKLLVTAFHPELTRDLRIHEYFIKMVTE